MGDYSVTQGLARLSALATWARGLLVVTAVAPVVRLLLIVLLPVLLMARGSTIPLVMIVGGVVLVELLIVAICAVLALCWIHRAHANLRLLGLDGLNYSPGWAVGSFFVPLINLIVPMRAMRELANRSNGEEAHFAAMSVGDVTSWWTCLVAGTALQLWLLFTQLLGPLTGIHYLAPPAFTLIMSLFSLLLQTGAVVFLYRLIGTITAAQKANTGVAEAFR